MYYSRYIFFGIEILPRSRKIARAEKRSHTSVRSNSTLCVRQAVVVRIKLAFVFEAATQQFCFRQRPAGGGLELNIHRCISLTSWGDMSGKHTKKRSVVYYSSEYNTGARYQVCM